MKLESIVVENYRQCLDNIDGLIQDVYNATKKQFAGLPDNSIEEKASMWIIAGLARLEHIAFIRR